MKGRKVMARKIPRTWAPTPDQISSCANWVFAQSCNALDPAIEGWLQEEAQLNQPPMDDPMFPGFTPRNHSPKE